MNKKVIIYMIIATIISGTVFFVGYTREKTPTRLYRIYLEGETIGYIKSKKELEKYINQKEVSEDVEKFLRETMKKYFPENEILYIVWGNSRDCPIKSPIHWGFLGLSWIHEDETNNNLSIQQINS